MPRGTWTAKDERKYEAILESCQYGKRRRSKKTCQRIAAATVNRDRRGLGAYRDASGRFDKASRLAERGFDVQFRKDADGDYDFEVRDSDGKVVGELIFGHVEDDDLSVPAYGVKYVEVDPKARGAKLGTKLWELAAEVACEDDVALVSDRKRSHFAEAFWRKQAEKGRAQTIGTAGKIWRAPYNAADDRSKAAVRSKLGVDARQAEVRGKVSDDSIEAFRSQWAVGRYILAPCGHWRDLSRIQGGDLRRAPAGLQLREVDTGSKRAFEFQAYLDGERVGEIGVVRRNETIGGRVVYAVHRVHVEEAARRKGIATKLYEAAAQEACRRRSRLASTGRDPKAHSHDFWAKQEAKGRAEVLPGRGERGQPVYILDCAFARDLSGARRRAK